MKKKTSPPGVNRASPTGNSAEDARICRSAESASLPLDALPARRRVRYIPGSIPREEPKMLPRLYVQGGSGGSVKMDLSGLGIDLIPGAFSFCVPDDTLSAWEIHRGDLALVQPFEGSLREGELLVVTVGLEDKMGRVVKEERVWCLQTASGTGSDPIIMFEHPIRGRVIGLLRLFVATNPVHYRVDDAHFAAVREHRGGNLPSKKTRLKTGKAKCSQLEQRRRTEKSRTHLLAAEDKDDLCFSEVESINPYARWVNTPSK